MRALRFVRFSVVGAGGLIAQLGVLWLLASRLSVPVSLATAIAVAAAIVHNFIWHRRWTWRDRGAQGIDAFVAFAAANGLVSLVGNVVITTGLVRFTSLGLLPANLLAIAICAWLNFWLADRLVFRPAHDAART